MRARKAALFTELRSGFPEAEGELGRLSRLRPLVLAETEQRAARLGVDLHAASAGFQALLAREDGDLERFYAAVRRSPASTRRSARRPSTISCPGPRTPGTSLLSLLVTIGSSAARSADSLSQARRSPTWAVLADEGSILLNRSLAGWQARRGLEPRHAGRNASSPRRPTTGSPGACAPPDGRDGLTLRHGRGPMQIQINSDHHITASPQLGGRVQALRPRHARPLQRPHHARRSPPERPEQRQRRQHDKRCLMEARIGGMGAVAVESRSANRRARDRRRDGKARARDRAQARQASR